MKVVLVLLDGVGEDVARERMGYLEHLVEEGIENRISSRAAIPTISRPNYETIHTGLSPTVHGITSNHDVKRSTSPNIFSLCAAAGVTTEAVACYWVSELYHNAPFDPLEDLEYDDPGSIINHGRFYLLGTHPDREVIWGGVVLAKRFEPEYLLVHPLGADQAGHLHGGRSPEYREAVGKQDEFLAVAVPVWRDEGYAVLVTADHGHNGEGHGGTSADERNVALYAIPPTDREITVTDQIVDQTQIAPTICELLGLDRPESMTADPIRLW